MRCMRMMGGTTEMMSFVPLSWDERLFYFSGSLRKESLFVKKQLEEIKVSATNALSAADDLATLDSLRVKYLGKKGGRTR